MSSIKTSETTEDLLRTFASKLRQNDNIIARLAFSYSMALDRKLSLLSDYLDNNGKEFKDTTLFGLNRHLFIGLICQKYELPKSHSDLLKYVKMHIDDGLNQINTFLKSNHNSDLFDFIFQFVERGIDEIEINQQAFAYVPNQYQYSNKIYKTPFSGQLNLLLGHTTEGKEPVYLPLNNADIYNNSHIAIAGQSGSGKTQFALDILYQISKQTKNETNFMYLDFKGLNPDDEQKLENFFQRTSTLVINAPNKQFPFNPLGFIDNINEKNKKLGIARFAEIISSYHDAASSRVLQLKDTIKKCFSSQKGGVYPTIEEIYETLKAENNTNNKVVNTLDGLSDPPVFDANLNPDLLNQNYYFSLSSNLTEDIRFTAIYLVINYIYQQFMSMPDVEIQNGIRPIRYVLLVDEAQVLFREKKVANTIQKMLEQIRSKGVSVVLLAQNIKEFHTPDFDFSSLCEFSFLLDIKEKGNSKAINNFLGLSDSDAKKIAKTIGNIQKGEAIGNIKGKHKYEAFNVSQFWKST